MRLSYLMLIALGTLTSQACEAPAAKPDGGATPGSASSVQTAPHSARPATAAEANSQHFGAAFKLAAASP
ncbi:MAG: hypothetical protein VB934_03090, partial [Polyangiaceae bacterium]